MNQIKTSISPVIENSLTYNLSFQNSLSSPLSPVAKYESLIDKIKNKIENRETWFSLEFFPPKTVNGASNLISK